MVLAYIGDALWVIALSLMFAASRAAALRTKGMARLPYLSGEGPRTFVLWAVPVASFAASLWPAIQARSMMGDAAVILFGLRAVAPPLLVLLHLRGLRDTFTR